MFWVEWAMAVHRAVWFPLNWSLGLEAPAVPAPLAWQIAADGPRLRLVKSATAGLIEAPRTPAKRSKAKAPAL